MQILSKTVCQKVLHPFIDSVLTFLGTCYIDITEVVNLLKHRFHFRRLKRDGLVIDVGNPNRDVQGIFRAIDVDKPLRHVV